MSILQDLLAEAIQPDRKIVLSEGADPRILEAAVKAREMDIARVALVGDRRQISARLGERADDGLEIIDPNDAPLAAEMAKAYLDLRKHKGVTLHEAERAVQNPNVFATLLVKTGHADGTIGGAVSTTADIVRNAIQIIGPAPDAKLISSFFLMILDQPHHSGQGPVVFADAGLVIDPDASEMAEIACASAASFTRLTGQDARVAMLSFSTRGSAHHERVSKVQEATRLVRSRAPDLIVDGEIQFDAAFVPEIAERKAPDSALKGAANVFVFPSLESGNIAYKIAQRIGGATAIGPVLQGLAKPANDLSRGCSAEDVLNMIAVTTTQCAD